MELEDLAKIVAILSAYPIKGHSVKVYVDYDIIYFNIPPKWILPFDLATLADLGVLPSPTIGETESDHFYKEIQQ